MSTSRLPAVAAALAVALAAAVAAAAPASFCEEGLDGWTTAFRDDFDGDAVNASSWNVVTGPGGSLGRSANLSAENVYVSDGFLVLKSERVGDGFMSGAVTSQNKAYFANARVCVRAMLPGSDNPKHDDSNDGIWPAHWLMPQWKYCWPDGGEIDVMEMINGDGNTHGTFHWSPSYPQQNCTAHNDQVTGKTPVHGWSSTLHEYAVEYSDTYVAFVADGVVYNNVTRSSASPPPNLPVAGEPYYVLLNTAIGGPWPKPPSEHTLMDPVLHKIDSVVVMQRGM